MIAPAIAPIQRSLPPRKLASAEGAQPTRAQAPYQPYGAAETLFYSHEPELLLSGPAGTGKSRACLEKLHLCACLYPNLRILVVRKTRKSVTQTAQVTFEQHVLPRRWLGRRVVWRTTEQEYRYPNGSVIVIGGLDKGSKVMSAEYDLIYVQEATELTEGDWEDLTTRLRNGVLPYQQLLADCNPTTPRHWLKLRADRGDVRLLDTRHEDNPRLYDRRTRTWTAEGRAYLARLDKLTGPRKLRLRYGRWVQAEGLVYAEWDRSRHLVGLGELQDWGILDATLPFGDDYLPRLGRNVTAVLAGVDWGYTNPGVLQVWALDSDWRLYLIHEVYETHHLIDWWVDQAVRLRTALGIHTFACDPSEPAYIQQFQAAGLPALAAYNPIAPGIQNVQQRLQAAGDGRPRLYVFRDALAGRDPALEEAKLPCGVAEEIDGYIWTPGPGGATLKEVPVKKDDHALDTLRYAAACADGLREKPPETTEIGHLDVERVQLGGWDPY